MCLLVAKFATNIKSDYLIRAKAEQSSMFFIDHFAGKVQYDVTGFLEKNRDWLPTEIATLFRTSEIQLVRTLFNFSFQRRKFSFLILLMHLLLLIYISFFCQIKGIINYGGNRKSTLYLKLKLEEININ